MERNQSLRCCATGDDFGPKFGRMWRETDEAGANRSTMVRNLLEGQYENPVCVVAFKRLRAGPRERGRTPLSKSDVNFAAMRLQRRDSFGTLDPRVRLSVVLDSYVEREPDQCPNLTLKRFGDGPTFADAATLP